MEHNHERPGLGRRIATTLSDISLGLSAAILLLIGGLLLSMRFWPGQDGLAAPQCLPLCWALCWALSWLALIMLFLAGRSGPGPGGDPEEAALLRLQVNALDQRVSELQQANAHLREAMRAAEDTSLAQSQRIADMGHDLRTPLNAILNFTRFLGKNRYGTLSARQQDLQQRVLANAERMLSLINTTLDRMKAEGGAVIAPTPPAPAPVDPDVATGEQQMIIVVDDDRYSQEILRQYLEPHGYAVTPVLDSRQAIERIRQIQPQLVILDVLMPYRDGWDLLTELKARPDVSAIPVLICSTLDQQRLAITLGANDYLLKPISEAALITRIHRLVAPRATILVVDDDPDARAIVRLALDAQPYRLIEAPDGRAGLAAVAAEQLDLIILDLIMPGVDGFAVLEQIRADPHSARTPIMVLTAKDLTISERDWLQSHRIDWVQKGQLSTEQLLARLTWILQSSKPNRPDSSVAV